MTLVFLTIAWVLGIVAGRAVTPPGSWLVPMNVAALLATGSTLILRRGRQTAPSEATSAAVLTAFVLGLTRIAILQLVGTQFQIAHYVGSTDAAIHGWVCADPDIRDTYTQITVRVESVVIKDESIPVGGKVLASVPHYPSVHYGDRVTVCGNPRVPPETDEFAHREYLLSRGITCYVPYARASVAGRRPRTGLIRRALGVKQRLRDVIESILPYPDAGLLAGILLGLGHTLPDELDAAFRRVGLTHIIVISGFNISLVAQIMMLSQGLVRRQVSLVVSIITVGLYALFVGADPPVARAAYMGVLYLTAPLVGRKSHSLTSLAFATLVMTATSPLVLWSVSFQLSFASTLGLIAMEPLLGESLAQFLELRGASGGVQRLARGFRDLVLVTLVAQAMTLPIIWHHFAEVSVLSLLANVLVLSIQPIIVVAGAAATMLGVLSLPVGRVAAWFVWPFLRYTIWVVERLGSLSWAAYPVPRLDAEGAILIYAALGAITFHLANRTRSSAPGGSPDSTGASSTSARGLASRDRLRIVGLAGMALITALIWMTVVSLPDGRLHIYFLDIGQGDAILIRSQGGHTVLVDGGPDPLLLASRLGKALPFWQHHLDVVVATHADQDHLAGLIPVMRHYDVSFAIESPVMGDTPLAREWHEAVTQAEVVAITAARGHILTLDDDTYIEVLHPEAQERFLDTADGNRNSVVLRVVCGSFQALLTADVDDTVEADLVSDVVPLQSTVLKAGHHGARSSTSEGFLAAVKPQVVVISAGIGNSFGHPHPEVLARLADTDCTTLRTDEAGTVEIITDGERVWLQTSR